jgi:hypothetical protein
MAIGSLGFPIAMPFNYQYLWGYPMLALAAAALCAPDSWLAVAVERLSLSARVERSVDTLSRQTYGAYVFHGLILSATWAALHQLQVPMGNVVRTLMFLVATLGAFGAAWAFTRASTFVALQWAGITWSPAGFADRPGEPVEIEDASPGVDMSSRTNMAGFHGQSTGEP